MGKSKAGIGSGRGKAADLADRVKFAKKNQAPSGPKGEARHAENTLQNQILQRAPTVQTVAWDTNMLLNIARFNVDVFSQAKELLGRAEFIVPRQVMAELGEIEKKGGKLRREARIAMELVEKRGVKVVDVDAHSADDALLALCPKAIIATNDKELKISVRELNGRVLYLRARRFLEMGGG